MLISKTRKKQIRQAKVFCNCFTEPISKNKALMEPTLQRDNDDGMYVDFLTRTTDLKPCQLWDYIRQKKKEEHLLFYQEFSVCTKMIQAKSKSMYIRTLLQYLAQKGSSTSSTHLY